MDSGGFFSVINFCSPSGEGLNFLNSLFKPLRFVRHFVIIEKGGNFLMANGGVEFKVVVDFTAARRGEVERGAVI